MSEGDKHVRKKKSIKIQEAEEKAKWEAIFQFAK